MLFRGQKRYKQRVPVGTTTLVSSPTPSPSPTPSANFYNGVAPSAQAVTVVDQTDLFTQINALAVGAASTTFYLAGQSTGANFAADYGTGRKIRMPTKNFTNPHTIRAADFDDMPLFQGGEVANWLRHSASNLIWHGIEFYDDETYATPSTVRSMFYNGAAQRNKESFKQCYFHGVIDGIDRANGHRVRGIDWRAGTDLLVQDCVFVELHSCVVVADLARIMTVERNSFIGISEHTVKIANAVSNLIVRDNLNQDQLPGYDGVPGDPYIEHGNFLFASVNAGQTLADITLENNLHLSTTDHSHAAFCLFDLAFNGPGNVGNNINIVNNKVWGKSYIMFDGVQGVGNDMTGNYIRSISDGAFGEVTTPRLRALSSQLDWSGNDAALSDEGGNTLTNTGAANINTGAVIELTTAAARAAFEAQALANGLQTASTLGIA